MPAVPTTSTSTATPVLQNGTYQIISAANERYVLSRSPAEDRSLLPKPVLVLPGGLSNLSTWTVTRNADGTYTLKNKNAPVINANGQVAAQLMAEESIETSWTITSVFYQGENQFIIESRDRSVGWNLRVDAAQVPIPFVQPNVSGLISTRSFPPQYPAFERFIFKRV
ncbi:hypothetical protein TWF694_011672 [Orbilia ellipsospora]|uniref:Ricin B lectin domain-containing protein n=1 Tax=Orbilia ellipsospora TaxID=2528407 RepID=A0AAV9X8U9_9PEZI